MISAFGVQHTVSKSYTKMAPKLAGALKAVDPMKSTNLATKLAHHAGTERLEAGRIGAQGKTLSSGFMRSEAKGLRSNSRAYATGAVNANKRKRFLP